MTIEEALLLYPEANEFDATGITPTGSLLRQKCEEFFHKPSTALSLTMFLTEVYKVLATEYVTSRP